MWKLTWLKPRALVDKKWYSTDTQPARSLSAWLELLDSLWWLDTPSIQQFTFNILKSTNRNFLIFHLEELNLGALKYCPFITVKHHLKSITDPVFQILHYGITSTISIWHSPWFQISNSRCDLRSLYRMHDNHIGPHN